MNFLNMFVQYFLNSCLVFTFVTFIGLVLISSFLYIVTKVKQLCKIKNIANPSLSLSSGRLLPQTPSIEKFRIAKSVMCVTFSISRWLSSEILHLTSLWITFCHAVYTSVYAVSSRGTHLPQMAAGRFHVEIARMTAGKTSWLTSWWTGEETAN